MPFTGKVDHLLDGPGFVMCGVNFQIRQPGVRLCIRLFFLVLLQVAVAAPSHAEDLVFQTKSSTIHYSQTVQLDNFGKKIRVGALNRMLNQVLAGRGKSSEPADSGNPLGRLFGSSPSETTSRADLGEAIDGLFKRVQLILDMPMPKLRVEIRIYGNEKEVAAMFTQLTGGSNNAPSFYWKKTNTIYIQTENLTAGMLAHEMGHAILDHYFAIQPPPKIAEMLCQYVDKEISSGLSEHGGKALASSHAF